MNTKNSKATEKENHAASLRARIDGLAAELRLTETCTWLGPCVWHRIRELKSRIRDAELELTELASESEDFEGEDPHAIAQYAMHLRAR